MCSDYSTNPLADHFPVRQLHSQSEVGHSALSFAVQQHILRLHIPVHNVHGVQVEDAGDYLCGVVNYTLHADASLPQLIDVKLEVSSRHQVHDQAQVSPAFVGVSQVYDEGAVNLFQDLLFLKGQPLPAFLFQTSLVQLLAGVHVACVLHLHNANLPNQNSKKP